MHSLEDVRDFCERVQGASAEPAGVRYAEVDAGGVPALWCISEQCDPDGVLVHSHAGGSVGFSMHTDRPHLDAVIPHRAWSLAPRQPTSSPRPTVREASE
jgi:hypothetical protein